MDLRGRLARHAARGREVAVPAPEIVQAPPSSGERPELAVLRARIAEFVARSNAKKAPPPPSPEQAFAEFEARHVSGFTLDDFRREAHPVGDLHVRTVHHAPSARVGRVELGPAKDVSASVLALLALDPSLGGCDPSGALFVDTETTGLAGGTGTIPFLIGLAWFDPVGEGIVVEQLLLRELGEEGPMLARLAERMRAASMLVSFNGKSYDAPLLRTRFVMNRLPFPEVRGHLDLVHVARRIHRAGHAPSGPTRERLDRDGNLATARSCKLTALEAEVLGFERHDDVAGAEIPMRYAHYLRTHDADAIRAICDHNLYDVVSMVALVAVYGRVLSRLEEGVDAIGAAGMVGLARTLGRAGEASAARKVADVAVAAAHEEGGPLLAIARRTRGTIAKRARDHETAIVDFEAIVRAEDDVDARLELAKLYEHAARDPERALLHAEGATREDAAAADRRRARLTRKLARLQRKLPGVG